MFTPIHRPGAVTYLVLLPVVASKMVIRGEVIAVARLPAGTVGSAVM